MTGNEIRQKFLEYFEKNGHKIVHSSPVYPPNDPTILFTNAGMNQFKDVFLGNERREYTRATSSQKCIRAGGKHNDLDEVGKTARHHTFFEMLGNFSFGDYFKAEAIKLAWDFLTGSKDEGKLGLNPTNLWFTYFEGNENVSADIEARDLWIEMGAKPERVLPFGANENFWQMGDTGPCGPCSEIHYYMGEDAENPEKNCPEFVNADVGDDTIEIWNLVFMQFDRAKDADGNFVLTSLPAPSVDTGAGLERIAAVMQGVKSNYETDLILPIVRFVEGLSILIGLESQTDVEIDLIANLFDSYKIPFDLIFSTLANYRIEVSDNYAESIRLGLGATTKPSFKVSYGTPHRKNINSGEIELAKDFIDEGDFRARLKRAVEHYKNVLDISVEQKQFACRVIADHARTTAFSIADGILPGNEGRAYVLRKIMRRAIYHGREHLGFHEAFFYKVCNKVVDEMKDAYPELETQREFIGKMVRLEEERFGNTMTVGLSKLSELLRKNDYDIDPTDFDKPLPGRIQINELAKLYDTFGLPIDLMFVVLKSKYPTHPDEDPMQGFSFWTLERTVGSNFTGTTERFSVVETFGFLGDEMEVIPYDLIKLINEEEFRELINEELKEIQKQNGIGQTKQKESLKPVYVSMERTSVRSNFHGYDRTDFENSKVVAIVKDDRQINELNEGDEGLIVLSETPFYAESGGQVGDTGFLTNENSKVKVQDTFAPVKALILHKSKVEKGSIKVGDELTATVDVEKRDATRRNHTATHLVHAALREVLGTHIKQAGSVVAPQFLRFDFTHYQPISKDEIRQIEDLVNHYILQNEPVTTNVMAIEEAMQTGAMALFGEKYGSAVRVLSVGGGTFSKELCGGTHVRATGDIGSFKITSDEAVASGVRRIRAITGFDAFERFREDERMIDESLQFLKTQRDQLPNAIERLQEELKRMRRENDDLKMKIATGAIGSASSNGDEAKDVNGVKVIAKTVEGLDKGGMRHLSDTLMAKIKSGVVILARTEEGKVSFIVRVSDDLTDRVKAGKIVQEIAPIVGGRGGGKPDMAEGGGTDAGKLGDALMESYQVIEKMLT